MMVAAAALALAVSGGAQTPPDPTELAAYRGLHAAAARGDAAEIERLARAGARLNETDAKGRTALHVAAFQARPDAVRALLALGIDSAALDYERYDAVTIASVANAVSTLEALLAGGASAKLTTSRYDGTALIAAAHLGHDAVVRRLIEAGAPLDHVNNLHWTAAIEAVVLGDGGARHQACLRALVDAGADLTLADRDGRTPLQLARARGFAAMVKLLEAAPRR